MEDTFENGGLFVTLAEDEELPYRVDDQYETHPSNNVPIKYEVSTDRLPVNATGIATIEPIEVTYYYKVRNGIVNIKYVDRYTGEEISEREHQEGKVDERYIVSEKNIPGYTYVDNSGNTEGTIKVDPTEVVFYYAKNVALTVNHIDKDTGAVLDSTTQNDKHQGDSYSTSSKDFTNYILVETPANANGTMGHEDVTVNYYYQRVESGLVEKHIDVISGDILYNETHDVNYNEEYKIDPRTFDGYDLVEDRLPTNSEGRTGIGTTTVTYYYIRRANVIVKYVEKYTGEEIPNPDGTSYRENITGHEDDPYTTSSKNFDNYVLDGQPDEPIGRMKPGTTEVIYEYKRLSGGVVVNHINILTNEQLRDESRLTGYVHEDYETEALSLANFDLVETPSNATGKFKVEEQRVTYYYIQKASVTVRYVDENNNDIIYEGEPTKETKTGHVGDDYTSDSKFFDGYILVEEPTNKDGKMTEEPIEVIYRYRKIRVNFSVDKIITSLKINGVSQEVSDHMAKAEIYRTEVKGQKIQISYTIKVTNDGELEGTAIIRDEVPSGMIMKPELNPDWTVTGNWATVETDIILPGETKEYKVTLDWEEGTENLGTKTNTARIVTTNNKYDLEETDKTDNESEADLIIAVSTGGVDYIAASGVLMIVMAAIGVSIVRLNNRRKRIW